MNDNIYKKTASYVTKMFEEYAHPNLHYHNLTHTKSVVERAQEIAAQYELNNDEMAALYIAAWFHDTGHLFAEIDKHEEKSVELMRIFMTQQNAEEAVIKNTEECILATRMPHEPDNLLQEIICDADTYHFGTKEFKATNKQVRKEYEIRGYTTFTNDWEKNTLDLLESHHYFTNYCKVLLQEGKKKNIERARKKSLKFINASVHISSELEDPTVAKYNNGLIARGVQTILRVASENHMELSSMADGKANILISVNAIIISVILSVLMRKLEVEPHLTIPTIIFLVFSVVTIVLSILATRPKITEGKFSHADVISKRTNLLFFGNFHKSTIEDYQWGMEVLMKDKDYIYGSLVKDIYFLGVILGRKYKLLRLAYTVFMIGIIVSVLAFTLAVMFAQPGQVTTVSMPTDTPL